MSVMLSLVDRLGIVVEEGRVGGVDEAIVNIQRLSLEQVQKVTIGALVAELGGRRCGAMH